MKNYHTHTIRCHHAIDSEEQYIKEAIKAGYTELGFSDHTPWCYETDFCSRIRMDESELAEYVDTLLKLKDKYKNLISIKIGLECEYFEKYMPWLKETLEKYPIDYIILGNHYNDTDETGMHYGRPLTKELLTKYVDDCIKAISTGLYSYIAHPDIARYNTSEPFYTQEMTRLCVKAKELDIPLEFNLAGFAGHCHYPNETFFKIVKTVGNRVIIGTDAHESQALSNMSIYQSAKDYLETLNIELTEDIKFLR